MATSNEANSHFITLSKAIEMTTRFRENRLTVVKKEYEKADILPICETFNKESFARIFNNPDCKAIRIYYGMSENLQVHAVIVGVDSGNKDILPDSQINTSSGKGVEQTFDGDDDGDILEEGARCPDECPPPSPLN